MVAFSFQYRAFLSYAHADATWGKWLHRALERYGIDKDLVGRETRFGPVPKTLRPIFRDREDFTGGRTLAEATVAALDQSAALLVLCSTISAGRPAVNEEVRLYRSRHPDRPVIPILIEGKYPDNLPPALRHEVTRDGTVTDRPMTILGPDLRDDGDGRALGFAKIIAGLTGLATDEIVRRAEREQRRHLRKWIIGLSGVIIALGALAGWAEINRRQANEKTLLSHYRLRSLEYTIAIGQGALLSNYADQAAIPLLRRYVLEPAEQIAHGRSILEAINRSWQGDSLDGEALNTYIDRPMPSSGFALALGVAHCDLGDLEFANGKIVDALASYRQSTALLSEGLADTVNIGWPDKWRRHLAICYARIGTVTSRLNDPTASEIAYRKAIEITQSLDISGFPGSVHRISDLAWLEAQAARLQK